MLEPKSAFHDEKQTSHESTDRSGVQGYKVLDLETSVSARGQAGGAISYVACARTHRKAVGEQQGGPECLMPAQMI